MELKGINKRILESLIKVGAMDVLDANRGTLLAGMDRILGLATQEAHRRESGQTTMFDLFGDSVDMPLPALELQRVDDVSKQEKANWERELMGVTFSETPLGSILAGIDPETAIISTMDLDTSMSGQRVTLVGQVASMRVPTTKAGKPFGAANLALLDGTIEVVAFGAAYEEHLELWKEGNLLRVIGKVRVREDQLSINCEEVMTYNAPTAGTSAGEEEAAPAFVETITVPTQPAPQEPEPVAEATEVMNDNGYSDGNGNGHTNGNENGNGRSTTGRWLQLMLQETDDPQEDEYRLREAMKLLLEFPGHDPVLLEVKTHGKAVRLDASITANCCDDLRGRLEELLGEGTVQEHSAVG
jgi:DNA polymerase-3 subunit alpha